MLPFGTLWSEARPDDMLEIDPIEKTIVTEKGDVKLDFITRSSQLLMEQPLDAAFYLHSEIYAKYSHIKGTEINILLCLLNLSHSRMKGQSFTLTHSLYRH